MDTRAAILLGRAVQVCALAIFVMGAGCRGGPPPPTANPAPGAKALADVALAPISGGYRVCAPRGLHACRVRAVTALGAITFPVTDIGPSPSCEDQEARAVQHCAGVGKPYDPPNLRCLAGQGIFNSLLHEAGGAAAGDEKHRLTVRCAEGETWIDLITPI
jgi:hypothetical protein